jgi:Uma2 family endonuclease
MHDALLEAMAVPNATLTVGALDIPADVHTLQGFRTWAAGLAEDGPLVSFYDGRVHLEMSPQNVFDHAPLVAEINGVLHRIARDEGLGRYFVPPTWVTVEHASLSTEPDGLFLSRAQLLAGAVRLEPNRPIEILGPPTMTLEVVSRTSARKDLVSLREGYAKAGVHEYWIVDAREGISFELLVLDQGAWVRSAPDSEGFVSSSVWGRRFRLRRIVDEVGLPDFRLDGAPRRFTEQEG